MSQSDLEDWADWTVGPMRDAPFVYPKWWQFMKKRQMRKSQEKLLKKMSLPWPKGMGKVR